MRVVAHWEALSSAFPTVVSRRRALQMSDSLRSLAEIAALHSRAEIFYFDASLALLDAHANQFESPMLASLYRERRKRLDSTWDSMAAALTDWLDKNPRGLTSWKAVEPYRQLRNSWAHGQGRLTRRQAGERDKLENMWRPLGIRITYEDSIVVDTSIVRSAGIAFRGFVGELDALLNQ